MAAPIWQQFMSVAHTDMNIPTIPGLSPHPVQVAEQQRIAATQRNQVVATEQRPSRSQSLMSEKTRKALERIVQSLRVATGAASDGDKPPAGSESRQPADRRADASGTFARSSGVGRP
jgi:penicillin-binding protein 1A